ncbi:MAG: lysophospholipid acyltransferase family protein [Actinomycetota bacterium]
MPPQSSQLPGAGLIRAYGRFLQRSAKIATGPAMRWMFGVDVEGLDRVPRRGPAIIAPNHLSFIDPLAVTLVVPRDVTYIGKAEYTDSWSTRWFMELGGVIPVRREDAVAAEGSLAVGVDVLQAGHLLGIFPEGTRSPDGRIYKGKTGAARMAAIVGCPIIPTGIRGTQDVLPKDAKMPKIGVRVSVKFGQPMRVPEGGSEDRGVLRALTDDLMQEIARLSGQEYRHRYSYTKKLGQPGPVAPMNLFA